MYLPYVIKNTAKCYKNVQYPFFFLGILSIKTTKATNNKTSQLKNTNNMYAPCVAPVFILERKL